MKILYISPINTVGTLELWKQFHESNGHQCTYITLFKSPLGVDSGVCLNLPLVAHSNKMVALRRIYYKIIRGSKGEYKPKDGYPPISKPNSIFEKLYFQFRDWIWSYTIESIINNMDLHSYDVYHLDWGLGLYRDARFVKQLKNKKIICTYHGQDLRTRGVIPDIDQKSNLNLTSELDLLSMHPNINYLFLPIDTKKYDCKIKVNKTIRICHSPTNRYYKGSEYIIPACKQIELENENVEFVLIENKTQKETIEIKSKCDILIDQVEDRGGWGYGMSSVEAMAMGLCCATQINNEYQEFIPNHPFININKNNIYEVLTDFVNKPNEKIEKQKQLSREWVEHTHDIQSVGNSLYDYYKLIKAI